MRPIKKLKLDEERLINLFLTKDVIYITSLELYGTKCSKSLLTNWGRVKRRNPLIFIQIKSKKIFNDYLQRVHISYNTEVAKIIYNFAKERNIEFAYTQYFKEYLNKLSKESYTMINNCDLSKLLKLFQKHSILIEVFLKDQMTFFNLITDTFDIK